MCIYNSIVYQYSPRALPPEGDTDHLLVQVPTHIQARDSINQGSGTYGMCVKCGTWNSFQRHAQ